MLSDLKLQDTPTDTYSKTSQNSQLKIQIITTPVILAKFQKIIGDFVCEIFNYKDFIKIKLISRRTGLSFEDHINIQKIPFELSYFIDDITEMYELLIQKLIQNDVEINEKGQIFVKVKFQMNHKKKTIIKIAKLLMQPSIEFEKGDVKQIFKSLNKEMNEIIWQNEVEQKSKNAKLILQEERVKYLQCLFDKDRLPQSYKLLGHKVGRFILQINPNSTFIEHFILSENKIKYTYKKSGWSSLISKYELPYEGYWCIQYKLLQTSQEGIIVGIVPERIIVEKGLHQHHQVLCYYLNKSMLYNNLAQNTTKKVYKWKKNQILEIAWHFKSRTVWWFINHKLVQTTQINKYYDLHHKFYAFVSMHNHNDTIQLIN